ncbi:MAG: glycosyltransferase family 4 protein [Chloroflexi bacterium]|nr:glycosyltransferase family 4 protein [Chloroflexota bacterium]
MRVLHCRQSERIWGPERQIISLAERLPSFGIELELVMFRRYGLTQTPHPLVEHLRTIGCVAHEVDAGPRHIPAVIKFMRSRLRQCDILHTHEFKSNILGYIANRLYRRPWVATDHYLAKDDICMRFFGLVDSWSLKRVDAIVTPSAGQSLQLPHDVDADRIHVIHHSINAIDFSDGASQSRVSLRRRYGVQGNQPLISVVGRLEPIKGHHDLLFTAKQLLAERPDLRFWMIGDGHLADWLQLQSGDLGLSHAVQFLGYQEDVASLIAASDIIVLPSYYESFGMVLIEAMSLAKPVIASAVGGIPEVISDGVHGYLFAPGDRQELGRLITRLADHPQQAKALGLAGQKHVRQAFPVDSMVDSMASLYRQMVFPGSARSHVEDHDPAWISASS